jgi:hypothetical protein
MENRWQSLKRAFSDQLSAVSSSKEDVSVYFIRRFWLLLKAESRGLKA